MLFVFLTAWGFFVRLSFCLLGCQPACLSVFLPMSRAWLGERDAYELDLKDIFINSFYYDVVVFSQ